MADVFISYKRDERSAVELVALSLRALGLTVWFDASLDAGEAFNDEIDREANEAATLLVCWSPAARTSRYVKAEAMIGFEADKLAACYVSGPDGFKPPAPFNNAQTEDLRTWLLAPSDTHAGWKSVLRRIGKLCGREDIRSWGALPSQVTDAELRTWIAANEGSPLGIVADSLLRARFEEGQERERREQAARDERAREEAERIAGEQAEAARREEQKRLALENVERLAREVAQQRAREEAEQRKIAEGLLRARLEEGQERERREQAARDERVREESERREQAARDEHSREEAERLERAEAERVAAQMQAQEQARAESEMRSSTESDRIAQEETGLLERQEAWLAEQEAASRAQEARERRAREEAEQRKREARPMQRTPLALILGGVVVAAFVIGIMLNAGQEQGPLEEPPLEQADVQEPQAQEAAPSPVQARADQSIPTPEMVRIPGRNFEVGRYEVTFAEWDACVAAGGCNGYRPDDGGWARGNRPAINVSWDDAQAYVQWLSQVTGQRYRLPSSAEWEIAARAGTTTSFSWGDQDPVCDQNARNGANFYDCRDDRTRPVGSFQPNAFGLYDMSGNVFEWVTEDECYGAGCRGRIIQGSSYNHLAGGSWSNNGGLQDLTSAGRILVDSAGRSDTTGFRVAKSASGD